MSLYFQKYFPSEFCAEEPRDRGHVAEVYWGKKELPTSHEYRTFFRTLKMLCGNCGSDHHVDSCDKAFSHCKYPLCRRNEKHATLMCKDLHSTCFDCGLRGHAHHLHNVYTPRQLENAFLAWCHRGLFTSIPFLLLSSEPEVRNKVKDWHFRYLLFGSQSMVTKKLAANLDLPWKLRLFEKQEVEHEPMDPSRSPARAHFFMKRSARASRPWFPKWKEADPYLFSLSPYNSSEESSDY